MARWEQRVVEGFSRTESLSVFFSEHMKGIAAPDDATINGIIDRAQSAFTAAAGTIREAESEVKMYPSFVRYLQEIVHDFPSKPIFADTHGIRFERLHPADYDAFPGVSGSLPGLPSCLTWSWDVTGTVFEFQFEDEPKDRNGKASQDQSIREDLVRPVRNARRISTASGCCYAFVVSVVGTSARLFRVDHSGWIATDAFDWTKSPRVFPEFCWRLYNGGGPGRILGADSTLSIPSLEEKKQMYERVVALRPYHHMSFDEATARSRWVDVVIDTHVRRCFTVGEPIFQSKDLFCQANRIDRVLIEASESTKMYVLKDVWQPAWRHPESDFLAVIRSYVGEGQTVGLTACLGSYNLGYLSPEHRTVTAALREGGVDLQDRFHSRTLSEDVGTSLENYTSTLALVRALCNAIRGHQTAFEAGVLHRDVSVGNILISETGFLGFLHDWDCSEFTPEGLSRFHELFPDRSPNIFDKSLMATGTYPFLALDLLEARQYGVVCQHECKHDLESFYWVLIWILLRHADHASPNGAMACSLLFDKDTDGDASANKLQWLLARRVRSNLFPSNPPLSRLVGELSVIFFHQASSSTPEASGVPATHESVLAAFDRALESDDWPIVPDGAKPLVPPIVSQPEIENQSAAAPSIPVSLPVSRLDLSLPASLAPLSSRLSRRAQAWVLPSTSAAYKATTSALKRKLAELDAAELEDAELEDMVKCVEKQVELAKKEAEMKQKEADSMREMWKKVDVMVRERRKRQKAGTGGGM
ncbi:hypothetical protein B0H15DRAFT_1021266 [Mycena belliarum]|uniref:Fungal-type protein kinase domain-containing protein n=1 Tax=Mycena belliarum TaxID=1033014 RepID=A0AAD6U6Z3_9AGAR|nr:hypothetical protein B0H15DRAFT_1021266 [Mycena belliae]